MPAPLQLDSGLQSLLSQLRSRVRRYIVWDSLLAILAIILSVFWIALAIDYLPVRIGGSEMPASARAVVFVLTTFAVGIVIWKWLVGRLNQPLPDDSLALLIERQHPKLAGRLVTAVQLSQPGRKHDSHSQVFLNRVHREALHAADEVDVNRVFRWRPIRQKLMLVVPLCIAFLGMAIASPSTWARAVGRLTLLSSSPWPRKASLEMVGVEVPIIRATEEDTGATKLVNFDQKIVRLARGSSATMRIRAAGESLGHEIPEFCTVAYVDDAGNRGQSNLRRVGRLVDGYQSFVLDGPPLASLADSVTLSIRGLDDRLNDFRVEAVEPPAIAEMKLQLNDPEYLKLISGLGTAQGDASTFDQELTYQAGVRVREGSRLTMRAETTTDLGEVDVVLQSENGDESEQSVEVEILDDSSGFVFSLDNLRDATAIRIVPRDVNGISAQAAYRYFIGIVRDQPPETTLRLEGIGSVITPIARLPVHVTAKDDYGIESIELAMNVSHSVTAQPNIAAAAEVDPYLFSPELDREGDAEVVLDLRELSDQQTIESLQPGMSVVLSTTAKDGYDLDVPHVTRGEDIRLQVVTPEDLLATLERRELEYRSRLEQAIDETRRLRQNLGLVKKEAADVFAETPSTSDPTENTEIDDEQRKDTNSEKLRQRQRTQLRIRQAALQASKTTDELAGIVMGLDGLLQEMINNRVDSVDRRERLDENVKIPLASTVEKEFPRLRDQIAEMESLLMAPQASEETPQASEEPVADANLISAADQMDDVVQRATQTTDDILLQLAAVLSKMQDLESFNEILDMVRGLIDDQEQLIEETREKQKKSVLNLFK